LWLEFKNPSVLWRQMDFGRRSHIVPLIGQPLKELDAVMLWICGKT